MILGYIVVNQIGQPMGMSGDGLLYSTRYWRCGPTLFKHRGRAASAIRRTERYAKSRDLDWETDKWRIRSARSAPTLRRGRKRR